MKLQYQIEKMDVVAEDLSMEDLNEVMTRALEAEGILIFGATIVDMNSGAPEVEKRYYPLSGFLYDLMRDHLPAGVVERLVQFNEGKDGSTRCFTKPHLYEYAKELRKRLVEGEG